MYVDTHTYICNAAHKQMAFLQKCVVSILNCFQVIYLYILEFHSFIKQVGTAI